MAFLGFRGPPLPGQKKCILHPKLVHKPVARQKALRFLILLPSHHHHHHHDDDQVMIMVMTMVMLACAVAGVTRVVAAEFFVRFRMRRPSSPAYSDQIMESQE